MHPAKGIQSEVVFPGGIKTCSMKNHACGWCTTGCNTLPGGSIETEFNKAGLVIEQFYGSVAGDDFDPGALEFAVVARLSV